MDNQQVSTENKLHWLGGMIDGEGCVTVCMSRQRRSPINYSPRICITNTDPDLINRICEVMKGADLAFHVHTHNRTTKSSRTGVNHKICYWVNIGGMKRCLRAAKFLSPYVTGVKKKRLEVMAEWIEYRLSLPHKHPQTETDMILLSQIREKPIDPLLAVPFRDRMPGSFNDEDEDTVQSSSRELVLT
jgi:hypothetical protein